MASAVDDFIGFMRLDRADTGDNAVSNDNIAFLREAAVKSDYLNIFYEETIHAYQL